jgi:hypothetical protein
MEYEKVVHLERMSREYLLVVTTGPRVSWTSYTPMYAER